MCLSAVLVILGLAYVARVCPTPSAAKAASVNALLPVLYSSCNVYKYKIQCSL